VKIYNDSENTGILEDKQNKQITHERVNTQEQKTYEHSENIHFKNKKSTNVYNKNATHLENIEEDKDKSNNVNENLSAINESI
jgi:hypothetical protein